MVDAARIVELHDALNAVGHGQHAANLNLTTPFEALIASQHQANFDLWHEEDKARDPDASDAEIVEVKHAIDRLNQERNDLVEKIDTRLLEVANQNPNAKLHSETPGLIIDRLSILSLKIFHSLEESERSDASDSHRARNHDRSRLLLEQRTDLSGTLDTLWQDVESGERRFKLYKQMKMYNDPSLNPVLYRRRTQNA